MEQRKPLVYVGTYTGIPPEPRGRGEGIYAFQMDLDDGALKPVSMNAGVPNPSFLAAHPDGRTLYAANETTTLDGQPGGAVSAFAIDRESGGLTFLNRQSSHGTDPCHVSIDRSGRTVMVANYTSGSIAVLPIGAGGRLGPASDVHQHRGSGPNPERQAGPHAHFITPDATDRFVLVADLGLDQVLIYRLDAERGTLTAHEPPAAELPPGSGPRHLAFNPSAPVIYVINELASTISSCTWDGEAGKLRVLDTITTLPDGFDGRSSCAEVRVAPSGRFVYGSNRGHDSIAIFAVDPGDGTLAPAGHVATQGANPRNVTIDPTGTFLLAANQDSDTIVTFRIDRDTGGLTATGHVTSVPSPVCVLVMAETQ
ncbi:MAG TPA: lactonase family protein [Thermomicrobiales bacterium]|nr:lactonase family protein [Thermomicrobiales bacterium]